MKILTVVGARPQFIKAATISRIIKQFEDVNERILHTGQHYDRNMSEVFFEELEIPKPDFNLNVGSHSHGKQTGIMLEKIEKILKVEKPDWVLTYGDTNSTLAASLAAVKLHLKTAHVEAGLRSYNRNMPEEINRIAADHISDVLFAPTENALQILWKEGLGEQSYLVGDVMFDSILFYKNLAQEKIKLANITDLSEFYLGTIHRPENTDNKEKLADIFSSFSDLDLPIVVPIHPRTQQLLTEIDYNDNVKIIDPVSYLEMITLLNNCKKVLTDSGGLQKEAYFLKKPCITLREQTEWIETLDGNWNFIVGSNKNKILEKMNILKFSKQNEAFGDGTAAHQIVTKLKDITK